MKPRIFAATFAALCGLALAFVVFSGMFPVAEIIGQKVQGRATVSDRIAEFGPQADARWKPLFEHAGVVYPPQKLVFLALKAEKKLEIHAQSRNGVWKLVRSVPVVRASGRMGPKLREDDYQVPEGFYKIEALNPNSAYHLAIRINYPNQLDREIAAREGRKNLGGNIMIHGSDRSVGCLAMGDEVAEDLFVLAERSGRSNVEIVLCPLDFRAAKVPADPQRPEWLQNRYAELAQFLQTLPRDSH